jgi:hypothetical protein
MKTADEILREHGIAPPPPGKERYYTTCPQCSANRSRAHQRAACLGVTVKGDGVTWGCNHCLWTGGGYYNGKINGPAGEPARTYDYLDEQGNLLFQKVRNPPGNAQRFWQRRPDGKGGWVNNTQGVRKVLYRLPEVIEAIASERTIVVVEGEKDADNLWRIGVPATCSPDGAADTGKTPKWRPEYSEALRGADIVVIPDHDAAGYAHAGATATMSAGAAKRVRVLALAKHWPECPKGGDISDWLAAGHTREELDALIERAPDRGSSFEVGSEKIDLFSAFTFLGDAHAAAPRELIKKLLPAYGVAVTDGQPSAGKTFIEIHKAVCLAKSLPFFGRKIVERVGTVFVAAEGRALIPNRFAAALAKHSITDKLPIAWINRLPDFNSPGGIKNFVRQLKAIDERFRDDFGVRLGQVPIDTVAACFGMKDEDDNAEATKICNVMRSIGEDIGALMAPVHHYGKNPESGLRGASAWKGSADIVQGVLADIHPLTGRASNRELVCAKARDGEEGSLSGFALEFIELGTDADHEPYGSCCVIPANGAASRFDKPAGNKGKLAIINAINEVLDGQGKVICPRAGMAPVKAARVVDVRVEFDRRYVVPDDDPDKAFHAKRMAFKRALDGLSPTEFGAGSAEGADWIWRVR